MEKLRYTIIIMVTDPSIGYLYGPEFYLILDFVLAKLNNICILAYLTPNKHVEITLKPSYTIQLSNLVAQIMYQQHVLVHHKHMYMCREHLFVYNIKIS
jgi:hypothetical protein